MQDQKRFIISLVMAMGVVVASAGAYAVFHAHDAAYDEAEADADLLDDLDTFPTLKKGDRNAPLAAIDGEAAPVAEQAASETAVMMTARRSAFRPAPPLDTPLPSEAPDPANPQLAYANPAGPPISPDAPFRAIDRAVEPVPDAADDVDNANVPSAGDAVTETPPPSDIPVGDLPLPKAKPTDIPSSDGQQVAALDANLGTPVEVPLPRRKPTPPRQPLVAAAPGPLQLGQVPTEPVKPARVEPAAPTQASPTQAAVSPTALALAPTAADKAPGSLVALPPRGQAVAPSGPAALPASPAEAARRERVVIPPNGGEDPPGVRPNRPVLASLTAPDTTVGQPPPVILRTPFGTPFVLQTSSVDMSCAPPKLVGLLRTIEKRYGKKVVVTSGNRTRGRRGSLHLRCMAADIIVPGVDADDLARYARTIPGIGGVGRYCHGNMIHVDIGRPREWKYGCGSYFVARDGSGGEWGRVPQEARGDD